LEQFWQAFASRGFVSDSWAFLLFFDIIWYSISKMGSRMCAFDWHQDWWPGI